MNHLSMAFKNLKNNFSFYALYLLSVSFVITIFFAFTSFSMNTVMLEKISGDGRVETMCNTISLFLMAFVIFYMSYSNRFFLRRRTKELGIYALLGYRKSTILSLLTMENLFSCFGAFIAGISLLTDRVNNMEGAVRITNHFPHGICIQITLPMKGDVSYQYFIS